MAVAAFAFLFLCILIFIGTVLLRRWHMQRLNPPRHEEDDDYLRNARHLSLIGTPQVRLENTETLVENDLLHDPPVMVLPEYSEDIGAAKYCFVQPGEKVASPASSCRLGTASVSGHHLRPDVSLEVEKNESATVDDRPPPYYSEGDFGTPVDQENVRGVNNRTGHDAT